MYTKPAHVVNRNPSISRTALDCPQGGIMSIENDKLIAHIVELRRTIEGGFVALIAQMLISEGKGKTGSGDAIAKAQNLVQHSKPKGLP